MVKNIRGVSSLIIRLLSLFLLVFLLARCGYNNESTNQDEENQNNIPSVEAVKAQYGSLPLSERLSGTVRAENQVLLSPEISGMIEQVYVQDGQKVKRGAPLVKLQDRQYREQYEQAKAGANVIKAQLKQAESQLKPLEGRLERMQKLRDKGLSSDQEYENMLSQVESARADVELAQAQLDQAQATMQEQQNLLAKTTVRAPIAGTVGQRNAERGMQITPSTQLFIIGNLEDVKIEVVLTEDMLSSISTGQRALVYINQGSENEQIIEATVARISPFLNDATRSTEAEIEVKNNENLLKPGMFIPVDVLYGDSRQATLIPTSALYTDPQSGDEGVFIATSLGTEVEAVIDTTSDRPASLTQPIDVQFKPINVIAEGHMQLGVEGIDPGSWVVTVGQDLLSQGRNQARVRVSSWNRIITLQGLQRQDLLNKVLEEQESSQESIN